MPWTQWQNAVNDAIWPYEGRLEARDSRLEPGLLARSLTMGNIPEARARHTTGPAGYRGSEVGGKRGVARRRSRGLERSGRVGGKGAVSDRDTGCGGLEQEVRRLLWG